MKKRLLVLLVVLLPIFVLSQKDSTMTLADSIAHYNGLLKKLDERYRSTTRHQEGWYRISDTIGLLRSRSKDYKSFVLLTELMHSDYDVFNRRMTAKGFSPMNEYAARVGFGMSSKWDRGIMDLQIIIGVENRSKRGGEKIGSRMSSSINYTMGWDVINGRTMSLYPFAGLGVRNSVLSYTAPDSINNNFIDITDAVYRQASAKSRSSTIGYQAGIGYDYSLIKPDNYIGFILFVKASVYNAFKKERQELYGRKYDPGIRHGDYAFTFGIKIAGKNER